MTRMSQPDQNICDRVAIWPIAVEIGGQEWFSLWGDGGGETDLLLAQDDRLILSASLRVLYERVTREQSNMRAVPMFEGFIEALRNQTWPTSYVDARFPFDRVLDPRNLDSSQWSAVEGDEFLSCLNLLWDVAHSINDSDLDAALRRGGGPMSDLADYLTAARGLTAYQRPTIEEVGGRLRSTFMADAVSAAVPVYGAAVERVFTSCIRW
jgi:hypothetical protein